MLAKILYYFTYLFACQITVSHLQQSVIYLEFLCIVISANLLICTVRGNFFYLMNLERFDREVVGKVAVKCIIRLAVK